MSGAYYNEIDPYAAQWLRNLITAGHIAPGDVDERSIEDVRPDDLRGYSQCHFFAGIGVWSRALRQSGWADDRSVWTGSCPCQPFSAAGKGAGFADERHLWPAWHWLIAECRPAIIFGEQVASKDVEPWIDLVSTDLEGMGYAIGTTPFPSAGVGAPHIRDRTYFVADANHARSQGRQRVRQRAAERPARPGGMAGIVADPDRGQFDGLAIVRGVECDGQNAGRAQGIGEPESRSDVCELAHANGRNAGAERQQHGGEFGFHSQDRGALRATDQGARHGATGDPAATGPTNGFWRAADWLLCRDEKWRPVRPGSFPLADGAPARVGRLRAYGNAINAEAAAEFIRSAGEAMTGIAA